jgi:cytoskeletal protein CcmA (bactofilin family)
MWKRDEAVRQPAVPNNEAVAATAQAASPQVARPDGIKSQNERGVVNIGKSVVIKGELNGSEDLTIEGHVEGKIELREHVLTIGPNGKIKAELFAKAVVVLGEVKGNITATEKVDIRENGAVDGRHHGAPRRDCRRRALPRQRRHGQQGKARDAVAESSQAGRPGG